ncbi:lysylphosphatidylglycerol synthase domain-containing protein [Acidihalobacter ferrooxydans]|uniref:Uncharacterized protein n=1 Tax=Acidihalobacter ferrooxydans TaxID=1765967 RepID=A0A1P8ULM3_9GAMM|nr:lysylphosphatidylglycerol synthase domain-containing protein [Acidihalobacter ferrooxydans]APZ44725.1 hypothetical protein BW247_13895 [Acidihalobacter ferrooxydans]
MRLWRWALALFIFVAFVAWLEHMIGWRRLLMPWLSLSLPDLLAALGLMLLTYGLRALRIYDYFSPALQGQFIATLRLTLLHNFFNNLLPMRTGEAAFPVLMRRYFDVPVSRSVPSLLWLRVLDLHVLLTFGWSALSQRYLPDALGGPLLALWLLVPAAMFFARAWLGARLAGRDGRFATLARTLLAGLPERPALFWRAWFWTGVNWAVKLAVMVFIFTRFDPLPWLVTLPGVVGGELGSVLPVHGVAGVGTYEAGVMAGLAPQGVALKAALVAAVNLHLFILGATVLGAGLARLLPKPVPREPVATD